MAISSPGIGSGLDVAGIVNQLVALERRPLDALDSKEAQAQAKGTAYDSLKSALSAFQTAVAGLASPAKFAAVTAAVGDTKVASVSATSSALSAVGTYSFEVQSLAQAHRLKSENFPSASSVVGTGTLTIQFGTYADGDFTANADKAAGTIEIDSSHASLAGVRDAINAANVGVAASIVNDGGGDRLTIVSKTTGEASALRITVEDDDLDNADAEGLSALAYDASDGGVSNLTQAAAAKNATVEIDGILVSKATNTISDAIEGVTLNLLKTNVDDPTTLTVGRSTSGTTAAVESFVKSYNDLRKAVSDLTRYDPITKKGAILNGDSAVSSVENQLRGLFNTQISTTGGLSSLSQVGIAFQKDGTLKLDATKLSAVLADSSKDVSALFAAVAKPTDSLVSFVSSTSATKNGTYGLTISQLATQGTAVGGSAAALTIGAGTNDRLYLTVDGVATSVTLAAGTYTATTLAAEIQSKVNGSSALSTAGAGVVVSQSSGVLTMTSKRYGAASTVEISGGSAAADLFGTQVETAGVDVAGTIGGVQATGEGQTLTAASGEATGLEITVTGGALGDRGTLTFARGYAVELDQLLGTMVGATGALQGRKDGISASIKDIAARRLTLERRIEEVEKRYRAQFTALDAVISKMNSTSAYLTQQLAGLAKTKS